MIFSKFYAECYDQIHSSKSYDGESARMLKFLETNLSKTGITRILDFGCGTGIHLNSLLNEKLELYGYDRNEYMLDVARQKFPSLFVASDYAKIPEGLDLAYSLLMSSITKYQMRKLRFSSVLLHPNWREGQHL